LIFYARKLQIKVYKHCTTVHCAYVNHYVLLLEKFNTLIDVIEHNGGTIGVHKKITEDILAQHTGVIYDSINWKLAYIDEQMKQATEKGK
jgi:hypothetical protein